MGRRPLPEIVAAAAAAATGTERVAQAATIVRGAVLTAAQDASLTYLETSAVRMSRLLGDVAEQVADILVSVQRIKASDADVRRVIDELFERVNELTVKNYQLEMGLLAGLLAEKKRP